MSFKIFNLKKSLNKAAINFDGLLEITDDLRNEIQHTFLEMYDDLKEMSDSIGITIYLSGGTAIGALRHQGFIPWDDDMDLNISREDFEKLKDQFSHSKLNEKYILNAPNYSEHPKGRYPQMIKKGTQFEEINDGSKEENVKGFKIDIFIVDEVSNKKIARFFKGIHCNILEYIATRVQGAKNTDNVYKDLLKQTGKGRYFINNAIGKIFSIVPYETWLNRIDQCINFKNPNSEYCTIATGRGHYFGEMLPREIFYPATKVEFCGRTAMVFHDPVKYLENLYGDFMVIPPIDKRERHFIKAINFGEDEKNNSIF